MVVDALVFHWESLLVVEREGGESSCDKGYRAQTEGREIRYQDNGSQWAEEGHHWLMVKVAFFYADDGMVASIDPGWLQLAFDMLTGLFYGVVLQTNVRKIVGMV